MPSITFNLTAKQAAIAEAEAGREAAELAERNAIDADLEDA